MNREIIKATFELWAFNEKGWKHGMFSYNDTGYINKDLQAAFEFFSAGYLSSCSAQLQIPRPMVRELISSSVILGMLPEVPGYNGSALMVSDDERDRIVQSIDRVTAHIQSKDNP